MIYLNAKACTNLALTIPEGGLWFADLCTPEDAGQAGAVAALVVGDMALRGTILSGGMFDGVGYYRVVGGAGRLSAEVIARDYANDAGVLRGAIVRDILVECGEVPGSSISADATRLGTHYTRAKGPAFSALAGALGSDWYAHQTTGAIERGRRSNTSLSTAAGAVVYEDNAASRTLIVRADSYAGLVPGVSVAGRAPARDIEITSDGQDLFARLYLGESGMSRRLTAFADIFRALDPNRAYRATYEFRVIAQQGDRYTLQPARSSVGLPILQRVGVRLDALVKRTVLPGALVLVTFIDGDPARPAITGFDDPSQPGWQALSYEIGGPVTLPIAYQGSTVQAGPFAGTVTLGSTRAKVTP